MLDINIWYVDIDDIDVSIIILFCPMCQLPAWNVLSIELTVMAYI